MRFGPADTPIAEMLEAILARSMDKDRVFEAHPAFTPIVRSLAPDEVRLLRHLAHEPIQSESGWPPHSLEITAEDVPDGLLETPKAFELYYAHLSSLGLCDTITRSSDDQGDKGVNNRRMIVTGVEYWLELDLLPFGKALMQVAEPSPSPADDIRERAQSS